MTPRERTLVTAVVAAVACAGVALGAGRLVESRRAADDAAARLAECRRLAERIEAQSGTPGPALPPGAGRERPPREADVIRRIESAAKSAGLTPDAVVRIEPMPPERVGTGPLRLKPTMVQLEGVTLRQALTFLHAVGAGRSGFQLKQVRLAAPSASDTRDKWSVEGTLTHVTGPGDPGEGDVENEDIRGADGDEGETAE